MRSLKRPLVPLVLLAALAAGCPRATGAGRPPSETSRVLTVVGISDFHGRLEPHVRSTGTGERVEVGGAALLAGYLEVLRATAPGPVLIVDAGDMWQGTLASNLQEGAPVVRLYEHLGVAAAALGNHEFDFGPAGPKAIPADPGDDPRGALKQRAAEADFPFLAANVFDARGHRPAWLEPSTVVETGGLRVGIVGAANPATPHTTAPPNLAGLRFEDPVPALIAEAGRLRSRVDAIVVLVHDGARCDPPTGADGLSGCAPGGLLELAAALPPGLVDVVVGGHTHARMARVAGETAWLQSGASGRALTWAEVPLDGGVPRTGGPLELCGRVVRTPEGPSCTAPALARATRTEPATFRGRLVAPAPAVARLLAGDLARVRALAAEPVGLTLEAPLASGRAAATPLGTLVAEVLRRSVPGAQVGLMNSGGVRADLPPGPLTRGAVFEALPFDNRPAELHLEGRQLERLVELGRGGAHGALQWSGLTFETDAGCRVAGIRVGGVALDPEATYRVVTNDYLARGGDRFDTLGLDPAQIRIRHDLPWLRDLFLEALSREGGALVAHARHAAAEAVERAPACVVDSGR